MKEGEVAVKEELDDLELDDPELDDPELDPADFMDQEMEADGWSMQLTADRLINAADGWSMQLMADQWCSWRLINAAD